MTQESRRNIVKFPAYRRFDSLRIIANDAMMALLIGGRVGRAMLAGFQPGAWLPTVAEVEDARRLNLRVGTAQELMLLAEVYLAYMGIPFALAVYQSLLAHTILLLRLDGVDESIDDAFKIGLDEVHDRLSQQGVVVEGHLLKLFDVVRQIRNRIIHYGGRQGSHLRSAYKSMPRDGRTWWAERASGPIEFGSSDQLLRLGPGELIGALALTKEMSRQVNEGLVQVVSRETWADVLVGDYKAEQPERFKAQAQRPRRLRGFARTYYDALGLTENELEDALRRILQSSQ